MQVKGNAVTFDCPQIAPLGVEIEFAAKNEDMEGLRHLIQIMASEIQQARLNFH